MTTTALSWASNSTLIVLGAMGILQPATSALLHASTLAIQPEEHDQFAG